MNSTHKVEVVPVTLERHPNADSLSVCKIYGYQVCVRTADWEGKTIGAYICPDSVVNVAHPHFSFLVEQAKADGTVRIKAKKLRGVVSFGMLVPAPAGVAIGDDVAEQLGVTHYEPPVAGEKGGRMYLGGEVASSPNLVAPKYDLEALRRYKDLFVEGELVVCTEKLDGCNSRYVWVDDKMHCGSRTEWKKEFPDYSHVTRENLRSNGCAEEKIEEVFNRIHSNPKKVNLWWEIHNRTEPLQKFCRDNPGTVVYGEIFGQVNRIKYGLPEVTRFAAFDILKDGRYLPFFQAGELASRYNLNWVPIVSNKDGGVEHQYNFENLCELAEGNTLIKDAKVGTIREGVVVQPVNERWDYKTGRLKLKLVNPVFLEKY